MRIRSSCHGTLLTSALNSASAAETKPGRRSTQAPSESSRRSTAAPRSAMPGSPENPKSEGWTTSDMANESTRSSERMFVAATSLLALHDLDDKRRGLLPDQRSSLNG